MHTQLPRPATIPEKGVELDCVIGGHITGGGVHTPLPRPAIIPEKGLELGCVIGGHITEGQNIGIFKEQNITLDMDTLKQTQQKEHIDGIHYCPDMSNFVLPSYVSINYKPGFSGSKGQAEQKLIHTNKLKDIVCEVCRNGPRCEFVVACWRKRSNHTIWDGSPCAAGTRTTQEDNSTVKTFSNIGQP